MKALRREKDEMSTATRTVIAVAEWRWFAETRDGVLRIEKAKKVPDESIQHLLDLAEGCELLSDELVEDHWFLEQKARFRRWRLTPEAVARIEAA